MLLFCELNTDSNSCCFHYSTNKSSSLADVGCKKRKYVHKTLREKCQSFKDLEKGLSNKDVTAKYGVPKNTFSTYLG